MSHSLPLPAALPCINHCVLLILHFYFHHPLAATAAAAERHFPLFHRLAKLKIVKRFTTMAVEGKFSNYLKIFRCSASKRTKDWRRGGGVSVSVGNELLLLLLACCESKEKPFKKI